MSEPKEKPVIEVREIRMSDGAKAEIAHGLKHGKDAAYLPKEKPEFKQADDAFCEWYSKKADEDWFNDLERREIAREAYRAARNTRPAPKLPEKPSELVGLVRYNISTVLAMRHLISREIHQFRGLSGVEFPIALAKEIALRKEDFYTTDEWLAYVQARLEKEGL